MNKFKNTRYERFVSLPTVGIEGMKKIRKAKITIVGAGGLGSVTATQLVALGVGNIRLIDNDIVEENNLQRQTLYRKKDIGLPKVKAAKKFLTQLNEDVKIEIFQKKLSKENVSLAIKNTDIIIDALDKFQPRLLLNRVCYEKNIPFLFGAVTGLIGNTMTIQEGSTCLECLYSHVNDEDLPSTSQTGIHPAIISIIANLQVTEATKIMIDEKPQLINRLLFCDIGSMEFESILVHKNPKCFCSQ